VISKKASKKYLDVDILRKSIKKKPKIGKIMSKLFFLKVSSKMVNNGHKIFKFRKIS
jgi:hypothetical protein